MHSVKIMWPRTPEEKSRNRHSGFVCFVNRPDAEDALAECDETDPFNVGRRIMVRWGRHVKKDAAPPPAVRRHCAANTSNNTNNNTSNAAVAHQLRQSFNNTNDYDHRPRIQVVPPRDPLRLRFITTVASFVAKDGSQLEKQLPHRDAQFSFLHSQDPDHVFYRWRVYSFIQGDSHFVWRTEPFVMLEPGGCLWIPPPVDPHAARRERQQQEEKAAEIRRLKEQRRMQPQRHHPAAQTGRSLERQRRGANERLVLSREEVAEFDRLFRHELCASRGAICRAMAFCFEKSACWTQICEMLRELLVDDRAPKKSSEFVVETKIAQLFLLSDVLFNSQQPGVKNAFRYRDAIEKMAPDVFGSFGSRSQHLGRWTRNKLATAVSAVLGAWTNWSVYNPAFLDELHARFEGREVAPAVVVVKKEELPAVKEEGKEEAKAEIKQEHVDVVRKTPQGDWAVVDEKNAEEQEQHSESTDVKQVKRNEDATAADGETPEDADGEPLDDDEDADGEPLEEDDDADADADGEPLDEEDDDADGEPLDDDDDDGEPLEEE